MQRPSVTSGRCHNSLVTAQQAVWKRSLEIQGFKSSGQLVDNCDESVCVCITQSISSNRIYRLSFVMSFVVDSSGYTCGGDQVGHCSSTLLAVTAHKRLHLDVGPIVRDVCKHLTQWHWPRTSCSFLSTMHSEMKLNWILVDCRCVTMATVTKLPSCRPHRQEDGALWWETTWRLSMTLYHTGDCCRN